MIRHCGSWFDVTELFKHPFEVVEYGWGEFEVRIRIYFHDPTEKFVEIFHNLKLFHLGTHNSLSLYIYLLLTFSFISLSFSFSSLPLSLVDGSVSKRPVVSERYEEIVFENPSEIFAKKFQKNPQSIERILPHSSIDPRLSLSLSLSLSLVVFFSVSLFNNYSSYMKSFFRISGRWGGLTDNCECAEESAWRNPKSEGFTGKIRWRNRESHRWKTLHWSNHTIAKSMKCEVCVRERDRETEWQSIVM